MGTDMNVGRYEDPLYRYGDSAINPSGTAQDPGRCVYEVMDKSGWYFYQCRFRRGKGRNGLYCGIHARRYPAESP